MGILINRVWPFEQMAIFKLTKSIIWNLVQTGQVVSEVKSFKDFMIL